jgi:hypothetical protein
MKGIIEVHSIKDVVMQIELKATVSEIQTLLEKYEEVGPFIDGIAIMKLNGLYGLIDEQGKEVYPPKCENIWRLANNFFKFEINRKRGIINPEGMVILMPLYKDVWEFKNERALVLIEYQGANWHLMEVSKSGDIVVPDYWKNIS